MKKITHLIYINTSLSRCLLCLWTRMHFENQQLFKWTYGNTLKYVLNYTVKWAWFSFWFGPKVSTLWCRNLRCCYTVISYCSSCDPQLYSTDINHSTNISAMIPNLSQPECEPPRRITCDNRRNSKIWLNFTFITHQTTKWYMSKCYS